MSEPAEHAGPPRRRWLLWGYLLLLVASHIVRLVRPTEHPVDADERTTLVHVVAGDRERPDVARIAYRDYAPAAESLTGSPPPAILLVHGSPGDNGEVSELARILGARYRAVAPDLPGAGGSSWDVPDYSNRAHARYLLQLMDSLGIQQAHLVGFSMGGGVVLQMQAIAPERVRSLTLLAGDRGAGVRAAGGLSPESRGPRPAAGRALAAAGAGAPLRLAG